MKAVIIGCGRLGAELANRLFLRGHEVSVVDQNENAFTKLPATFVGRFNEGDAMNRDVLHRAGMEYADTVAVVTDSDVLNGVVGYLARSLYNVPSVVVRNHDPRYRPILEAYGLQVVSAMSWGAQRIEELIYDTDMRAVFSAGNGEVEIYEVSIPEAWQGRAIEDLVAPESAVVVSVTRAGRAMLPQTGMRLAAGDTLHISATLEGIQDLQNRLGKPKK